MNSKNGGIKKVKTMLDDLIKLYILNYEFFKAKNFVEQYKAREELKSFFDLLKEKYPDLELEP